jgi:hypothetical protein
VKTVWKFALEPDEPCVIDMPYPSSVIRVGTQGDQPFLWAVVDPEAPTRPRSFWVRGTGHAIGEMTDYLGSFTVGVLEFHVFE